MGDSSSKNVTGLLQEWSHGNQSALDELLPVIYSELRQLARYHLRLERPEHTLQPTALANEAYLRLIDQHNVQWRNRAHFFAIAAQIMRRILVDHARKRRAAKRGGAETLIPLDEDVLASPQPSLDVVRLDDALSLLEAMDPRQGRVVELRYFGGLTVKETGEVLGISPATVKSDWSVAKRWLYREIKRS